MISVKKLNEMFEKSKTSVSEIVVVNIACPGCDYVSRHGVMDDGIRSVQYCHNLECEVKDFDVDISRIESFELRHEVEDK